MRNRESVADLITRKILNKYHSKGSQSNEDQESYIKTEVEKYLKSEKITSDVSILKLSNRLIAELKRGIHN